MKRFWFAIGMVLVVASVATAQDLKRTHLVWVAAGAADIATTLHMAQREGFREQNPFVAPLQRRPVLMVAVGAAEEAGVVWVVEHFLKATHPTATRRIVKTMAVAHFGFALSNLNQERIDRNRNR